MAALMIVAAPSVAVAQTAAAKPAARVEVEAYGGLGRLLSAGEATLSLPPAGAPITTSSPLFPSRRVSSWFFGDGAALLNDVAAELALTSRVTPLDSAIAGIGRSAESRGTMGARLRFRASSSTWLEIGVDVSSSSTSMPASLAAAAEATRASFAATMTELLASGPFTDRTVVATMTPAPGSGAWRDVTATVAANIDLKAMGGVTPFVTLGGGVVTRTGAEPAVTLAGHYSAKILGSVPIDETDTVTIRGIAHTAPAITIGGGLSGRLGDRIGLRLDGRLIAANRTIGADLDATPHVTTGTPADFIESLTNPSIQFSNNPSTGRRSSLSGDALDHVEVARSTRLQSRVLVTLGAAFRF
jgi:hypothetical protein